MQDPCEEGSALRLHGPDEPVYTISVAARLLGVHPQTLRVLERYGLVCPSRTENNIRLYSENDLILLQRICHLMRVERINVAGIKVILRMEGLLSGRDEPRGEAEREGEGEEEGEEDEDRVSAGGNRGRPGVRRIPVEIPGRAQTLEDGRVGGDEEVRLYGQGRGHRPGDH